MNEIVKHINDTNASYRTLNAGDAKNTDLFLDNEHYELFKEAGGQVTVRFNKENLSKAILFIASILPRKYDNSAIHKPVSYSAAFVYDQLLFLDYYFKVDGMPVTTKKQTWNARKDVPKKNGEIDNRFYFNGLLEEVEYVNTKGEHVSSKFTIRNYLAGGYSDIHIKRADDGIFDVWVTNVQQPYFDDKEDVVEIEEKSLPKESSLQQIFYGAPGTGKSHTVNEITSALPKENVFRTTFHPDSDYSTFVGCYKPTMKSMVKTVIIGQDEKEVKPLAGSSNSVDQIAYEFVPQVFAKAYVRAYQTEEPVFLVIEEINRGNCAQIFGDIFQLLDRDDNGVSKYAIKPDSDLENHLVKKLGDKYDPEEGMRLPNNLYIWATMNTSDQSLFPIDSAFKRRWDWQYIPIENHSDKNWKIKVGEEEYDWWEFLEAMNKRIYKATYSEDKQMGYFFVRLKDGEKEISEDMMVNKVLFYLFNDVFKDHDSGDLFKVGNEVLHFSDYTKKKDRSALLMSLMKSLELKSENEKKGQNAVNDTSNQATLDF